MTDEQIVAALAEALYGLEDISEDWPWGEVPELHRAGFGRRAAALLPTVRRIAEQRAAEELLWAGTEAECRTDLVMLKRRAAALTAVPEHGRSAT